MDVMVYLMYIKVYQNLTLAVICLVLEACFAKPSYSVQQFFVRLSEGAYLLYGHH